MVVAGAGPAGAATARMLAHYGHRVLLLDPIPDQKRKVGESLPGAARPLLRDLGILALVEQGPHLPSYGNLSAWGSPQLQTTDFLRDPHGAGWHLDRARFDTDLRTAAQQAGAVLQPTRLRTLSALPNGWKVGLEEGETTTRWLVDATGRRASIARRLGSVRQRDDTLVALCAWTAVSASDQDSRALIEAAESGWWYTALLPDQARVVVFHGERAHAVSLLRQPGAWQRTLAQTAHIRSLVPEPSLLSKPFGTEACGGYLETGIGLGWLAVGDAALSFDPLASQGILNALYTGLRAGQALHAALLGDSSGLTAYATQLQSIRRAYLQHHRLYYQQEQRWPTQKFWAERHDMPNPC